MDPDDPALLDVAKSLWRGHTLPDGLAKRMGLGPDDVDQEQLAAGVRVEFEHTSDPAIALEIALSHLAEHPDYYTRLLRARL